MHGGDYFDSSPDCCCIGKPRRMRIIRSELTGNGTNGECDVTEPCADLAACTEPVIRDAATACDRSHVLGSGVPGTNWEICTGE